MKALSVTLLLTLLVGCACFDDNQTRVGVDQLGERQQQWQLNAISNYQLNYRKHCFCEQRSVEVVIEQGLIRSATEKNDNEEIVKVATENELVNYFTVDKFFRLISELDQSSDGLTAKYDASLGYPVNIEVDPQGTQCSCAGSCTDTLDDEYGYDISITLLP